MVDSDLDQIVPFLVERIAKGSSPLIGTILPRAYFQSHGNSWAERTGGVRTTLSLKIYYVRLTRFRTVYSLRGRCGFRHRRPCSSNLTGGSSLELTLYTWHHLISLALGTGPCFYLALSISNQTLSSGSGWLARRGKFDSICKEKCLKIAESYGFLPS